MMPFDHYFDLNHDGKLSPLEKGAEMAFLSSILDDDESEDDDQDEDFDDDDDDDDDE